MVNKNKELAVNTAILTIGRICTQFMSFFLMPLYTAALSTDDRGYFFLGTGSSCNCCFSAFWTVYIDNLQVVPLV